MYNGTKLQVNHANLQRMMLTIMLLMGMAASSWRTNFTICPSALVAITALSLILATHTAVKSAHPSDMMAVIPRGPNHGTLHPLPRVPEHKPQNLMPPARVLQREGRDPVLPHPTLSARISLSGLVTFESRVLVQVLVQFRR
jgi:hypothetical protein